MRIVCCAVFFASLSSSVLASSCNPKLIALAIGIGVQASSSGADIVQPDLFLSNDRTSLNQLDLYRSEWPYDRFKFVDRNKQAPINLFDQIHRVHERFADYVFYLSPAERRDPGVYRENEFIRTPSIGREWEAISGGWSSVVLTLDSSAASQYYPTQVSEVIYESAPHTPGVYQFTTIDYSGWPFNIRITHYAWIIEEESYGVQLPFNFGRPDPGYRIRTNDIPSVPVGAVFLVSSIGFVRRRR